MTGLRRLLLSGFLTLNLSPALWADDWAKREWLTIGEWVQVVNF